VHEPVARLDQPNLGDAIERPGDHGPRIAAAYDHDPFHNPRSH
jgi:hypothetical protein